MKLIYFFPLRLKFIQKQRRGKIPEPLLLPISTWSFNIWLINFFCIYSSKTKIKNFQIQGIFSSVAEFNEKLNFFLLLKAFKAKFLRNKRDPALCQKASFLFTPTFKKQNKIKKKNYRKKKIYKSGNPKDITSIWRNSV